MLLKSFDGEYGRLEKKKRVEPFALPAHYTYSGEKSFHKRRLNDADKHNSVHRTNKHYIH